MRSSSLRLRTIQRCRRLFRRWCRACASTTGRRTASPPPRRVASVLEPNDGRGSAGFRHDHEEIVVLRCGDLDLLPVAESGQEVGHRVLMSDHEHDSGRFFFFQSIEEELRGELSGRVPGRIDPDVQLQSARERLGRLARAIRVGRVHGGDPRVLQEPGEASRAGWVQSTYITDDTEVLAAKANERAINAGVDYAKRATRYDRLKLPEDVARKLQLLKNGLTLAAPSNPKESEEVTRIGAAME